jgi:Subtilase family/Bacterial Ig domain
MSMSITTAAAAATRFDVHGAGTYVVSFRTGDSATKTIDTLAITPTARFTSVVKGFSAKLTGKQVERLRRTRSVVGIMPVVKATGAAQTVNPQVYTVQADKPPVSGGDGVGSWTGPSVAVLDSGGTGHVDFNLANAVDCTNLGTPTDRNGHGTAVMGAMAAYDNSIGMVGMAPGAPIYSVRVLDEKLGGSTATMLCGLDWVSANAARYNIKVVNMSLGLQGSDDGNCGFQNGDTVHQAICSLISAGLVMVASAGNSAVDLANYVPGAYDEVLTATNMADYDGRVGGLGRAPCNDSTSRTTPDDRYASTSNWAVSAADKVHVLAAPGVCPYSTKMLNHYDYIASGTSMAGAMVSGVVLSCFAQGDCAGRAVPQVIAQVKAQAEAATVAGAHSFLGDPTMPVAGRYYGYLASTVPVGSGVTPTPTPTSTPTPTPTSDTTPPTVQIVSPQSGTVVSGDVVITAQASDNVGVTSVTLYAGATRLGEMALQPNGTWSLTLNTRSYANGSYNVSARASDAAGNTRTSSSVNIRVSN